MCSNCLYNLKAFAHKKKFQQPLKFFFCLCKTGTKCYLNITSQHKYMYKKTKYIGFIIYVQKLFGNRAIDKIEGSEEASTHKKKQCEGSNANFFGQPQAESGLVVQLHSPVRYSPHLLRTTAQCVVASVSPHLLALL